jgi:transcriptional regulator with XRE-family HTH domain
MTKPANVPGFTISGQAVRSHRTLKGWSQRQLGRASMISERTVRRIENGQTTVHPDTVSGLAKTLGVRVSDLLVPGLGVEPSANDVKMARASVWRLKPPPQLTPTQVQMHLSVLRDLGYEVSPE